MITLALSELFNGMCNFGNVDKLSVCSLHWNQDTHSKRFQRNVESKSCNEKSLKKQLQFLQKTLTAKSKCAHFVFSLK